MGKFRIYLPLQDIRQLADKTGDWTYSPGIEDSHVMEATGASFAWGIDKSFSTSVSDSRFIVVTGENFQFNEAYVPTAGTAHEMVFLGADSNYVFDSSGLNFNLASLAPIFSGHTAGGDQIDMILKLAFAGSDTIHASSLNDTISGDAGQATNGSDEIFGGAGNDRLFGNGGTDRLHGGKGEDMLWGGKGYDRFIFDQKPGVQNADRVMDFTKGSDKIVLKGALFGGLVPGDLEGSQFRTVYGGDPNRGTDPFDRIIYDKKHGDLYFDVDGSGSVNGKLFAHIENHATLSASDFLVV